METYHKTLVFCLLDFLIALPSGIRIQLLVTPSLQIVWIYLHCWRLTYATGSLLHSVTPAHFKLCYKPRLYGVGGGVGFLIRSEFEYKQVDSLSYRTFETIIISVFSPARSCLLGCVYRPPGFCSTAIRDEVTLFEFLS